MDFNAFGKDGFVINTDNQSVKINANTLKRTLQHIAAPVFDFFISKTDDDKSDVGNIDEEITNYEMQSAVIQQILNDADPKTRKKLNFTI